MPAVICLSPYLMQVSAISRALLDDARAFFSGSRASSFLGLSRQRASRHSASKEARQGSRASILYVRKHSTYKASKAALDSWKPAATHSPGLGRGGAANKLVRIAMREKASFRVSGLLVSGHCGGFLFLSALLAQPAC